jgi:hypothetical protein
MKTLDTVLQENPDLSSSGFLTKCMDQEDFQRMRLQLAAKQDCGFDAAINFLEGVKRSRAMTPARGSYGLKHLAEKHQGVYISNGAMIAALLATGVAIRRVRNSPNVDFGIGLRWLKQKSLEARNRSH